MGVCERENVRTNFTSRDFFGPDSYFTNWETEAQQWKAVEVGGRGEKKGPESLGKSGPRPWSPDNECSAESGMREGGGNRVVGEEGTATSLTPALPCHHRPPPPPSPPSAPLHPQAGEEEVAGRGCAREGGEEEGPEAAAQGAGALREGSRHQPPPFLQTWTPQLIWDVSSLQRRQQQSLSPALWLDPASNAGRALQKEAWAGSQLGKAEPRNGGGEQPKPSEAQSFP